MWPSASTIEKFICATGTPWKKSASSRLSGWFAFARKISRKKPRSSVKRFSAQRPHALDRRGLGVVLGLRAELGGDVVWSHAGLIQPTATGGRAPARRRRATVSLCDLCAGGISPFAVQAIVKPLRFS